jgi:hypothetical protein
MRSVMHEEVVRHSAAEALVPTARIEPQQMVAKSFHVRGPEPSDFNIE